MTTPVARPVPYAGIRRLVAALLAVIGIVLMMIGAFGHPPVLHDIGWGGAAEGVAIIILCIP